MSIDGQYFGGGTMGFDQDQLVPPVLRRATWGRQDEKARETSEYFLGEWETREKARNDGVLAVQRV